MRTTTRLSLGAAFLAVLACAVGCEDTALTPGADFTMSLVARPSAVLIDATHPEGQASIVATVFSDTGVPQSGITVLFSSSGGTLSSGNGGVKTDNDGNAIDTLTLDSNSPAEITVTANSAALTQTVTVNKTSTPVNHPPVAAIVASPAVEQAVGRLVVFDGSTSTDADAGDFVETYDWVVTSSAPDPGKTNPIVFHATTPNISFAGFVGPQTLTVNLLVSDHFGLASAPAQKVYTIKSQLCSDNVKPTAVIAGAATQTVFGSPGNSVTVTLDGTLSTDPEGPIESYTWTCGNGAGPVPVGGDSSVVTCAYVVEAASHTYTPTLVVADQGFGPPALSCQQLSTAVSIQVVVAP